MSDLSLNDYGAFLRSKAQRGADGGFEPVWMPDFLFDFQRAMLGWSIRKGRAATFADCGLGKTPMGLVWAVNVAQKTGRPVLYLTPLAVASQTVREAEKFGIDGVVQARDGMVSGRVLVTNYERLHHFSPADFAGVVCDESSILKSFAGERRGVGAELKPSYYRQAVKNVQMAAAGRKDIETSEAFDFDQSEVESA